MDLTLEALIAGIESGLTKSAAEDEKKDSEKKKDESNDKGEKKDFPFAKKDEEDKKEGCEDDKKSEGQEKEASLAGAALANEVMKKVASLNLHTEMNKQASTAGQALARALLKKASAGDLITTDGIAPGVVPNKNQVDNAQMEAEGATTVKPIPTGDGVRATGTVNEIFDAMIADALSQGAASTDQVHETGLAANEGNVLDHAVPNQVKTAALNSLVERGFEFDVAVEMVKEAKDHMLKAYLSPAWQENAIAKDHGKEGPRGVGPNVASHVGGTVRSAGRALLEGAGAAAVGAGIGAGVAALTRGRVRPDAGAVAGGVVGYEGGTLHGQYASLRNQAKEHHAKYASEIQAEDDLEKAAAVTELVAQGINFDDAFEMVKQAEAEIAFEMEKAAALSALMDEGVNFEDAVALVKQASAGDLITTDGIAPGVVPNKNQVDNAQMEAEGAATVKPIPTGDGVRATGTVNQIFDGIVADALSQGAAGVDQVHEVGVAKDEGNVLGHAVPNQVKVAALNSLLEQGFDFAEASELVTKSAAAAPLLLAGPKAPGMLSRGAAKLKSLASAAKEDATKMVRGETGKGAIAVNGKGQASVPGRGAAAGRLAKNPLVAGTAALGAGAAGAAALSREKKAAVDSLIDAGIDFDSAVELVNAKAQELYGA